MRMMFPSDRSHGFRSAVREVSGAVFGRDVGDVALLDDSVGAGSLLPVVLLSVVAAAVVWRDLIVVVMS